MKILILQFTYCIFVDDTAHVTQINVEYPSSQPQGKHQSLHWTFLSQQ